MLIIVFILLANKISPTLVLLVVLLFTRTTICYKLVVKSVDCDKIFYSDQSCENDEIFIIIYMCTSKRSSNQYGTEPIESS